MRIDLHLSSFKLGLFIIAIYNLNIIHIFDFISLGFWSEGQCFLISDAHYFMRLSDFGYKTLLSIKTFRSYKLKLFGEKPTYN